MFEVGQRVRVKRVFKNLPGDHDIYKTVGKEGELIGVEGSLYEVLVDGTPFYYYHEELEAVE